MEHIFLFLSDLAFNIVNWPLVILNQIGNIFFVFCLIFPPLNRDGIKQPLNLLLGSLISCTIIYLLMSEIVSLFYNVTFLVINYTLNTSMTSSVWLIFFYYTQIVPCQGALSIWVKRNIKYIIYCALFVDRMFYLFDFTVSLLWFYATPETTFNNYYTSSNTTIIIIIENDYLPDVLYYVRESFLYMIIFYSCVCLCVMSVSSFTTVRYLHRHIRSMSGSSSPFSSPRLQSQVRVTITGILQAVLYFSCAFWILFHTLTWTYSPYYSFDDSITYLVVSLYMTGTTVNLAVGQALFRQRAAEVWLKVSQPNSLRLCGS